jgi:two-component system sensor histidine kinase CpxA
MLIVVIVLVTISLLFRHTISRPFHDRLLQWRATDAALIALELETETGALDVGSPEMVRAITEFAQHRHRDLMLLDREGQVLVSTSSLLMADADPAWVEEIPCGERTCQVTRGPPHEAYSAVPLRLRGEVVGTLRVDQSLQQMNEIHAYLLGLLWIGVVGLLGVAGLSLYLTRPLRQMSRSMDRIAQGDLDHRVEVKGQDEVARMGESFNAMADRVSSMIRHSKEILAGVSHELRSPLTRMKLSVELLTSGSSRDKHLRSLTEDIDLLDQMVEELLTASRLDLGTQTIRPEECALDELIDEAWSRIAFEADATDVTLSIDVIPEDLTLRVDRALVVRLMGNLLENAVRYAPGAPVEVRARPTDTGRIELSVRDQGPGVAPDALDHLFEPFYRADPSRSRRTGGTGLGLMIVQRAVESHGGTVHAAPADDQGGLVVTFDLPSV